MLATWILRLPDKVILRILRRLAAQPYCLRRPAYSEPLRFILSRALGDALMHEGTGHRCKSFFRRLRWLRLFWLSWLFFLALIET
jgi:hypothetical protein